MPLQSRNAFSIRLPRDGHHRDSPGAMLAALGGHVFEQPCLSKRRAWHPARIRPGRPLSTPVTGGYFFKGTSQSLTRFWLRDTKTSPSGVDHTSHHVDQGTGLSRECPSRRKLARSLPVFV